MSPEQPDRLAILLDEYYTMDMETGRRLEEEMLAALDPLIRSKIRDGGLPPADAEEMWQEAQIKIVTALRQYRANKKPITHLPGLAATIVCYIVKEEIRRTAPEYCMKRDIRHLVMYSPLKSLLARWQIAADWLIGLAQWKGEPFRNTPQYVAFCRDDTAFVQEGLEGRDPANAKQVKLPELLLKFLQWAQTPLEELKIVACLLSLRSKTTPITLSLEKLVEGGAEPGFAMPEEPEVRLNWEAWWQAICKLPDMSRAAILLAMEPEELVVLTSLASPCAQVADALNIAHGEMRTLWVQLPLSDEDIALRYKTTVNNIQQRRFYYLTRLRKKPGLPPPL